MKPVFIKYHTVNVSVSDEHILVTKKIEFPDVPPVSLYAEAQYDVTMSWLEKMALKERIQELEEALKNVMKSYECYCHTDNPEPECRMDEYDFMMRPFWEEAKRVVGE